MNADTDLGRVKETPPPDIRVKEKEDNISDAKSNHPEYYYKKENSEKGYLSDPRRIAEYIREQQIDIYQNALLGDYGADGTYALPDEVQEELIKAKKIITNSYENFLFVQSIRPIGKFGVAKFFIKIVKLDNKLLATLTFVEPVHKMNKLVTNAQSVQIASYVGNTGEDFYYEMRDEFNIVSDDYVMPEDVDMFENALAIKLTREAVYNKSLRQIEAYERRIYNNRMEVLKKQDNEFSKEVLNKFNNDISTKGQFFDNVPNQYICLNQMMESCMDMFRSKYTYYENSVFNDLYIVNQKFLVDHQDTIDAVKIAIGYVPGRKFKEKDRNISQEFTIEDKAVIKELGKEPKVGEPWMSAEMFAKEKVKLDKEQDGILSVNESLARIMFPREQEKDNSHTGTTNEIGSILADIGSRPRHEVGVSRESIGIER